jgi:hypothetical protein
VAENHADGRRRREQRAGTRTLRWPRTTVIWPLAVLILTPVIVVAGLLALVVVVALGATGRLTREPATPTRRLAPVIPLDNPDLNTAFRRAA